MFEPDPIQGGPGLERDRAFCFLNVLKNKQSKELHTFTLCSPKNGAGSYRNRCKLAAVKASTAITAMTDKIADTRAPKVRNVWRRFSRRPRSQSPVGSRILVAYLRAGGGTLPGKSAPPPVQGPRPGRSECLATKSQAKGLPIGHQEKAPRKGDGTGP